MKLHPSVIALEKQRSYEMGRAIFLADKGPVSKGSYRFFKQDERHHEVKTSFIKGLDHYYQRQERLEIQEQIMEKTANLARRRESEQALAQRMLSFTDSGRLGIHKLAEKMMLCHVCGTVGIKPSGGHVVAWDCKCGSSKLCPHEANQETKRLSERVVPALQQWVNAKANRRLFYMVPTWNNFEQGRLLYAKKYLVEHFRKITTATRACTDQDRAKYGLSSRKKTVPVWPQIKGSFVVQEDPLSARGDWNVHLNVILCVEGEFSYEKFRAAWGKNIEIKQLKKDTRSLLKTIQEVVKYSVTHVAVKSDDKAASGKTDAPPLIEWEENTFKEWFRAQKGFRRVRSYGCIYRLGKKESEFSMDDIEWLGSIKLTASGKYYVDLIPEDNFSRSREFGDNFDEYTQGRGAEPPNIPH